jgi:uncharacterized damage-inducible protein DinB
MESELQYFMTEWERQTAGTIGLLEALPRDQYHFRPDASGRSLGELAWHLAEVDIYVSLGIEQREFRFDVKPPNSARPMTVEAMTPAFRAAHLDAAARIARLEPDDLNREIRYTDDAPRTIRRLLWGELLMHVVHHRGQLMLLCRLAGGVPPELFGRTREGTAAQRKVAA